VPELALEEWIEIINQLHQAGTFVITITGGEPALYRDLPNLLHESKLSSFKVIIISNGTYWDETLFDAVSGLPFVEVQISIYGSRKQIHDDCTGTEGSFTLTIETIRRLLKAGISVHSFCPVLDKNANDAEELKLFCERLGVHLSRSTLLFPSFKSLEQACHLKPETRDLYLNTFGGSEYFLDSPRTEDHYFPCSSGQTGFTIAPDGHCFPCEMIRIPFASVQNDNFLDHWKNHPMLACIRSLNSLDNFPKHCKSCTLQAFCKRCPAFFRATTGSDYEPPKEFCEIVHRLADRKAQGEMCTKSP